MLKKIVRAKGANSVQIVSESLLWFDAEADITADVIAKMRANSVAVEPMVVPATSEQKTSDPIKKDQ